MTKRKRIRWWPRFVIGSALALSLGGPTAALAEEDQTPAQPSEPSRCVQMCEAEAQPQPGADARERAREAASSEQAQSGYQLGASPSSVVVPPDEHPYTQAHFQLGAGHED